MGWRGWLDWFINNKWKEQVNKMIQLHIHLLMNLNIAHLLMNAK